MIIISYICSPVQVHSYPTYLGYEDDCATSLPPSPRRSLLVGLDPRPTKSKWSRARLQTDNIRSATSSKSFNITS